MTIQPQKAAQASAHGVKQQQQQQVLIQKCKWFLTTNAATVTRQRTGNVDWQSYLWHELESAKVEGHQQSQMHCSLPQHGQEDIQAEDGGVGPLC